MEEPSHVYTCEAEKTRYRRASMLSQNECRSCLGRKQLQLVSSYDLRAGSRSCVRGYPTRFGARLPNPQHPKTLIDDAQTTTSRSHVASSIGWFLHHTLTNAMSFTLQAKIPNGFSS